MLESEKTVPGPRSNTARQFLPLPPFPAKHHFRLGAPSYVYPADILTNVRALAPGLDDIELILFESKTRQAIPTPKTIALLGQLAAEHSLTYTIHLPIDRQLGSAQPAERRELLGQIIKIIKRVRPLRPYAYILHLEGIAPEAKASSVKNWQGRIAQLLPAICDQLDMPGQLCLENLAYPFAWCEVFLELFGLGVCLDTGHLQLAGGALCRHYQGYAERTRVIHLHGVKAGRDHQPLPDRPAGWLQQFLNSIDNFNGVLTLELFNAKALQQSLKRLSQCLLT